MRPRAKALTCAVFAAFFIALSASALGIHIDGALLQTDVPPFEEDGTTLLPLRAVSEALGCKVGWDDPTQTVTVTKGQTTITFVIGSPVMTIGDAAYPLPHVPVLSHDRTFIPVRALSEALGFTVGWDAQSETVGVWTRSKTHTLSIGAYTAAVGSSTAALMNVFGAPSYAAVASGGLNWYVYDTYPDAFYAFATDGGIVCGYYTCSRHFKTSEGLSFGMKAPPNASGFESVKSGYVTVGKYYDLTDGTLFAVSCLADGYENTVDPEAAFAAESRMGLGVINAFRYEHGLAVLSWDDAAAAACLEQARYVALAGEITHVGLDGTSGIERYKRYDPAATWSSWGENVCAGAKNVFLAVNAFINTPGYRRIVLSDKSRCGIGMIRDDAGIYRYAAVALFIK